MKCRHCKRNKGNRARGLCYACSLRPEVRSLHPPLTEFGALVAAGKLRVIHLKAHPYRALPPESPTLAFQGSAEKKTVMAKRVAAGQSPFHREDGPR